ncbi:hypothetical protein C2G38_2181648 [Gigaspora rosea]|uniref:Uncharacterized protein n=1 Tax=Gigaspora rosea TaxID=44941 RepID=A0A397VAG8_9GLOM|nr:hypothetical protein C2G38_2181648 [Gigaspora rosea]
MSVSTMEEAKEKTPTSSWQYNNENCYEGDKEHRLANQGLSDIEAINRLYDLEPCYKGKSRGVTNKIEALLQYKKAMDTKHVDKIIELCYRHAMKIEKGTLVDYQESVKRDKSKEIKVGMDEYKILNCYQNAIRAKLDKTFIILEWFLRPIENRYPGVKDYKSLEKDRQKLRDQFQESIVRIVEDVNRDFENDQNNSVV